MINIIFILLLVAGVTGIFLLLRNNRKQELLIQKELRAIRKLRKKNSRIVENGWSNSNFLAIPVRKPVRRKARMTEKSVA